MNECEKNRHRYREQTRGCQWGEERGEGQDKGMGLRGLKKQKGDSYLLNIIAYFLNSKHLSGTVWVTFVH